MAKFFIISGILIFILTFLIYFNTLNGFFTSDDYGPLGFTRDKSLVEIIKGNIPKKGDIFIRPVSDISWKIDYSIWQFNPLGYHITNTTLHALSSILVFVLAFLVTNNKPVAFFAGILFSVHPLHPEAVVRLADRYDLLHTFFYLLSLVTFVIYSAVSKRKYFYIISILSYPIALLSKETAITLPFILVLWRFIFKRRRSLKLYIPYFTTIFIYLTLRFIYIGDIGGYRDFEGRPLFLQFDFSTFLKKMVYNIPMSLILPMHQEVIKQEVRTPIIIIFFIGIAFALYSNRRYINKFLLLFGLSFIAVNLIPIYNIVWVGPDLQGARLMYLPSVGFCLVFAYFLLGNNKTDGIIKQINLFIIIIFSLLYAFITFKNSQPWNMAGRITGQIPKIVKEYSYRFSNGIKFYFLIPDTIQGTSPYGHYIPETLAPLISPLKPEDVMVISDLNYGDTGEYRFYDFDLRSSDFVSNLVNKRAFFFKWNELSEQLEDISASIKSKLNNPKQDTILPKTYYFTDSSLLIKDVRIPVVTVGALELKMCIKSKKSKRVRLEIFWLSNQDTKWDFRKHIYFPVEIDGEFHIYHIPFYLFNPDWLDEVYLEELKFQLDEACDLETEYIRFLPCPK